MPAPSPHHGLRPRTPLGRRLGGALLVVALVLTIAWAIGGGGRAPSGSTPSAPPSVAPAR